MNFIEAIKAITRNKNLSVKRKETIVSYYECFDKLYIDVKYQSDLELFTPTVDDILAEDWYVVKDEKLHTFEEALKAYKSGKHIRRKGYHYMVYYDFDCEFDRDDVMANDWIIID